MNDQDILKIVIQTYGETKPDSFDARKFVLKYQQKTMVIISVLGTVK